MLRCLHRGNPVIQPSNGSAAGTEANVNYSLPVTGTDASSTLHFKKLYWIDIFIKTYNYNCFQPNAHFHHISTGFYTLLG